MTRSDKRLYLNVLKLLSLRAVQLLVITTSVALLGFVAFHILAIH